MTLRYTIGDYLCSECGSDRLEYDQAARGGLLQCSSVPSGFLLLVLVFPAWDRERASFYREGGGLPQQDNKFCCFDCGTVHDAYDPLGLSSIDEDCVLSKFRFWFLVRGCGKGFFLFRF